MAEHKTFVNQNILIPRGSEVTATVSGRSQNVRVTVFISGPGIPAGHQAPHPAAWNQVVSHRLPRKGTYSVIVDVDMLASATVTADLRVLDPDGNVWLAPWVVPVAGTLGDAFTFSYALVVL